MVWSHTQKDHVRVLPIVATKIVGGSTAQFLLFFSYSKEKSLSQNAYMNITIVFRIFDANDMNICETIIEEEVTSLHIGIKASTLEDLNLSIPK